MQMNRIVFIFAFSLCIPDCLAQPLVEIVNDRDIHNIGKTITIYVDQSHRLSIGDILADEKDLGFTTRPQSILNIGVTDAVLWGRFNLLNKTDEDCYLEISNTALDSISVFEILADNT